MEQYKKTLFNYRLKQAENAFKTAKEFLTEITNLLDKLD